MSFTWTSSKRLSVSLVNPGLVVVAFSFLEINLNGVRKKSYVIINCANHINNMAEKDNFFRETNLDFLFILTDEDVLVKNYIKNQKKL